MTKAAATKKAKRYAENNRGFGDTFCVIRNGNDYDVVHLEYVEELKEIGFELIATYKYDYAVGETVNVY